MDVLIVEDNASMAEELKKAVYSLDDISSVTTAQTVKAALRALEHENKPDLLICDLWLPDGSGIKVIEAATQLNTQSIVVSALNDEVAAGQAIAAGANGYLLKELDYIELVTAFKEILNGGSPLTPSIARHLLTQFRNSAQKGQPAESIQDKAKCQPTDSSNNLNLTSREIEVLQLIARGFKIIEVADKLCLSEHTVVNHNRSVYRKLKVHSRSEAVYVAMQSGLVALD